VFSCSEWKHPGEQALSLGAAQVGAPLDAGLLDAPIVGRGLSGQDAPIGATRVHSDGRMLAHRRAPEVFAGVGLIFSVERSGAPIEIPRKTHRFRHQLPRSRLAPIDAPRARH
jgi:hypothetical protein